jgi:hypothetical protein
MVFALLFSLAQLGRFGTLNHNLAFVVIPFSIYLMETVKAALQTQYGMERIAIAYLDIHK